MSKIEELEVGERGDFPVKDALAAWAEARKRTESDFQAAVKLGWVMRARFEGEKEFRTLPDGNAALCFLLHDLAELRGKSAKRLMDELSVDDMHWLFSRVSDASVGKFIPEILNSHARPERH